MKSASTDFRLAFIFLLSALLIAVPADFAAGQVASKLLDCKVVSPALRGNLLGDPEVQAVSIYLPPGYQVLPMKRFPTLYLLHGFTGKIEQWTVNGYQGMNLRRMMDHLIESQAVREMIVVVPNGANAYSGSFYTNSTVTGNWEDFICRDLVSYVDQNYRTIAKPQARGVAGHSMGGFGAILLAMKHPEVFSALYAMSPACLSLDADLAAENPSWRKVLRVKSRDEIKVEPKTLDEFYVRVFIALSAAFSPNSSRQPLYVDFPFEERNGQLIASEPANAQWHAKMPLYLVEQYKQNLSKLRGIYIDVGEREEFPHIRLASARFSSELAKRSIPHIYEIYAGGDHGSKIKQRMEKSVLPFFSRTLESSP
jgi:S-formylglutathione hydrolase FrmB